MATYSKVALSGGAADGTGIELAIDSGTFTTVHTGSATATTYDEVWIYAANYDSSDRKLTIEWGSASAGDLIEVTIPTEAGLVLVVPGLIIKGNATPLVVAAFAATTSSIQLFGYVNQITA